MGELKTLFCVVLASFICVLPDRGFSKEFSGNDGDDLGIPRLHPRPDMTPPFYDSPDAPNPLYPVAYVGLPQNMTVTPLPSKISNHELVLNVSWLPPFGSPARDYSIVVNSTTETKDCSMLMLCYEYNIPSNVTWFLIPSVSSTVADACTIHPGCAYEVRLTAHPWDGHTAAHKYIELEECVAGVCSCAHAEHLPTPEVSARIVSIMGEIFVNVTWSLPPPSSPQRLPRNLTKQSYYITIAKEVVVDWYPRKLHRYLNTTGLVMAGEDPLWLLVPVTERTGPTPRDGERRDERSDKRITLDVKILARVSLVDERGCFGPEGNATAYDPTASRGMKIGPYILWAALGGACIVLMVGMLAVSARVVKRILRAFRPAPVSAPHESLWFPLQRCTCSATASVTLRHKPAPVPFKPRTQ